MSDERESARIKKVTVTIHQEWEPIDPDNLEDVKLAQKLSEPHTLQVKPRTLNMGQKRDVERRKIGGAPEDVELIPGPTTFTITGEVL